jgi:hypothetical protein
MLIRIGLFFDQAARFNQFTDMRNELKNHAVRIGGDPQGGMFFVVLKKTPLRRCTLGIN